MSAHTIAARVLDVNAASPPPLISATDPTGRRAGRAWLLVRADVEPIGSLMVDLPDEGLSDTALDVLITSALGEPVRAALASRAAAARERDEAIASGPPITVVVCTRDRPAALARCLDSLFVQRYRNFRVLVVDNAPSSDATSAVVRAAGHRGLVERIVAPHTGLSRARNAAVAAASGETLAWIDDDEVADRYWLCGVARALIRYPEADVVSGPVAPAELETPAQVWFEQFGGHSKGRGFTHAVFCPATAGMQSPVYPLPPFGVGANLTTRAGVVEAIGGFDVALGAGTRSLAGEDTLALTQVLLRGGTIVYQPSALVWHYHRRDLDGLYRQMVGYGTGLTAAYTGLVLRQPDVLARLFRLLPGALRYVVGTDPRVRAAAIAPDFPAGLLRAKRRAMLRGPGAYLRGRWQDQRLPRMLGSVAAHEGGAA